MTREDIKGKIQTVLGPIGPDELGPTLMHEHLLCDITPPALRDRDDGREITLADYHELSYGRTKYPTNYRLDMPDVAVEEVRAMRGPGAFDSP